MITKKINHTDLTFAYGKINGFLYGGTGYMIPIDGKIPSLLTESISQGAKTKLRKILHAAEPHLKAWQEAKSALEKEKEEQPDNVEKQGETIVDEEFDFTFEPINTEISKIDDLVCQTDYSDVKDLFFE